MTAVVARLTPYQRHYGTHAVLNGVQRQVWRHDRLCFARRLWAAIGCPKKTLGAG